MISAADGNPLLALESARAAAAATRPAALAARLRPRRDRLPARARAAHGGALRRRRTRPQPRRAGRARQPGGRLDATDSGLFHSTDGRFGYRHALLREAVYADLDDARRDAPITRRSGRRSPAPPSPRTTSGARAATTSPPAGWCRPRPTPPARRRCWRRPTTCARRSRSTPAPGHPDRAGGHARAAGHREASLEEFEAARAAHRGRPSARGALVPQLACAIRRSAFQAAGEGSPPVAAISTRASSCC